MRVTTSCIAAKSLQRGSGQASHFYLSSQGRIFSFQLTELVKDVVTLLRGDTWLSANASACCGLALAPCKVHVHEDEIRNPLMLPWRHRLAVLLAANEIGLVPVTKLAPLGRGLVDNLDHAINVLLLLFVLLCRFVLTTKRVAIDRVMLRGSGARGCSLGLDRGWRILRSWCRCRSGPLTRTCGLRVFSRNGFTEKFLASHGLAVADLAAPTSLTKSSSHPRI
jgi:hypothetical protein